MRFDSITPKMFFDLIFVSWDGFVLLSNHIKSHPLKRIHSQRHNLLLLMFKPWSVGKMEIIVINIRRNGADITFYLFTKWHNRTKEIHKTYWKSINFCLNGNISTSFLYTVLNFLGFNALCLQHWIGVGYGYWPLLNITICS